MPITDLELKRAKPKEKAYKITDGQGLYILVKANGGKYFHFDFRHEGKRGTTSFGVYPDVSLAKARELRSEWRRLLADGKDPRAEGRDNEDARAKAEANRFEPVAREWFNKELPSWAPSHGSKIISRLERFIFPTLGKRPISEITGPELLACLRPIEEAKKFETAHRTLNACAQVYRYAYACGKVHQDITANLRSALATPITEHFAAITDPKEVAPLLRAIDEYQGAFVTRCALRLAPHVFVRPGELRNALWEHIDFEKAEWRFTSSKTKAAHIVPLSTQAISLLREVQALTGRSIYVFTGPRSNRPLSDNTLPLAMRALGFEQKKMTVHGFRATARTIIDEVLGYPAHLIEQQLAHAVPDTNGRAYNRTAHLPQRKIMMQAWSDYLDELKKTQ